MQHQSPAIHKEIHGAHLRGIARIIVQGDFLRSFQIHSTMPELMNQSIRRGVLGWRP
jgi:hypothetical protein